MAHDHTDTPSADPTDAIDPTGPDHTDTPPEPAKPAKVKKAAEPTVAALKAENERLKRENDQLKGNKPAATSATGEPGTPGDGPVLWAGTLEGDPTAPKLTFNGPESEAEAREAYLEHCGILSTDKKVRVTRVDETADAGDEADAEGQEAKAKKATGKAKAAKKKQ